MELVKSAYEDLRRSEEFYRTSTAMSAVGIFRMDPSGAAIYVNKRGVELAGQASEKLLGRGWLEVVHPDDRDAVESELKRTLVERRSGRHEFRFKHQDGKIVWVIGEMSPVISDDKVVGLVGTATDITARRASEEVLHSKADLLRRVLDALPIGVWIIDSEGRVIDSNPSARAIWGGEKPDGLKAERKGLGRRLPGGEETGPDDWAIQRALNLGDETLRELIQVKTADGSEKVILNSAVPLRDPNGNIIGGLLVNEDYSSEWRKESDLIASEQQFHAVNDAALDGLVLVDASGAVTYANDSARKLFGFLDEDLVGMRFTGLIPQRFHKWVIELVARCTSGALSTKIGEVVDLIGIGREGAEFPVDVAFSAVVIGSERVMMAAIRDARIHRKFEIYHRFCEQARMVLIHSADARAELWKLSQLAVEYVADWCAIHLLDDAGEAKLAAFSHRDLSQSVHIRESFDKAILTKVTGFGVSEAVNTRELVHVKSVPELVTEDPDRVACRRLIDMLNTDACVAIPLLEGEKCIGAITLALGALVRTVDQYDSTLLSRLGRCVAASIEKSILIEKTKSAVSDREEILRIVAHDLRNPLSSILVNCGLIKRSLAFLDGIEKQRATKLTETTRHAAEHMERIIGDIVDFGPYQSGRLGLDIREYGVPQLLEDFSGMITPLARTRSIRLEIECDPSLPALQCDRERVTQVLSNLVGNAMKFSPNGSVVTIRAEHSGSDLRFSVSDQGPGIAAEDLAHVFERYWQAHAMAKAGTGLGLFIARQIVEAHHGRIWASSTPGHGSTFFFTIPYAAAQEARRNGSCARSGS